MPKKLQKGALQKGMIDPIEKAARKAGVELSFKSGHPRVVNNTLKAFGQKPAMPKRRGR